MAAFHLACQFLISFNFRFLKVGLKLKHTGLCLLQSTSWIFCSEHATKLFSKMFTDSKIAKKFSCSCKECAAIDKEALAPHFTSGVLKNMVHPFLK